MVKNFDIAGARAEGYTDDEIANHLAQQRGFNIQGARAEGYSTSDILGHLMTVSGDKPKAVDNNQSSANADQSASETARLNRQAVKQSDQSSAETARLKAKNAKAAKDNSVMSQVRGVLTKKDALAPEGGLQGLATTFTGGLAEGLTLGTADHLAAAGRGMLPGSEGYQAELKDIREEAAQSPYIRGAGTLTGAMVNPLNKLGVNAAGVPTLMRTIGLGGAQGAVYGAASADTSEAESVVDALLAPAAEGAQTGAAIGGAFGLAAKGLNAAHKAWMGGGNLTGKAADKAATISRGNPTEEFGDKAFNSPAAGFVTKLETGAVQSGFKSARQQLNLSSKQTPEQLNALAGFDESIEAAQELFVSGGSNLRSYAAARQQLWAQADAIVDVEAKKQAKRAIAALDAEILAPGQNKAAFLMGRNAQGQTKEQLAASRGSLEASRTELRDALRMDAIQDVFPLGVTRNAQVVTKTSGPRRLDGKTPYKAESTEQMMRVKVDNAMRERVEELLASPSIKLFTKEEVAKLKTIARSPKTTFLEDLNFFRSGGATSFGIGAGTIGFLSGGVPAALAAVGTPTAFNAVRRGMGNRAGAELIDSVVGRPSMDPRLAQVLMAAQGGTVSQGGMLTGQ